MEYSVGLMIHYRSLFMIIVSTSVSGLWNCLKIWRPEKVVVILDHALYFALNIRFVPTIIVWHLVSNIHSRDVVWVKKYVGNVANTVHNARRILDLRAIIGLRWWFILLFLTCFIWVFLVRLFLITLRWMLHNLSIISQDVGQHNTSNYFLMNGINGHVCLL